MNRNLIPSSRTFTKLAAGGLAAACLFCQAGFGQTIPNPSFEANSFTVAPGFISDNTPITGWTASPGTAAGLNPAGGTNVYADNGAIPDGTNVAFLQAGGTTLGATLTGLTVGTTYKVTFRANATAGQTPNVTVSMDSAQAFPLTTALTVYSVGSTNPYAWLAFEFTAAATSQVMTLLNDAFSDSTLLVDDFKIAPTSGRWQVAAWNDDTDSGVDPNYVYTHAYNFGSSAGTVINTISFTGVAGANPAVSNKFSTTFLANTFGNDANNITGGSRTLANDFVYGGTVPAGSYQSITLLGLTPGTEYVATIYSVGFDDPSATLRWATFSVGEDRLTINQDQFGNNNGILISYRYTAGTNGSVTLRYAPVNPANVSIHTYGFSNRESVSRNTPPVIALQPQSTTVSQGVPVTFSVTANGIPAPAFQWRFNGTNLAGAMAATYSVGAPSPADAGGYDVVVSNLRGSITSIVARLTVGIPMTNPSFEADTFTVYPGYVSGNSPITGWASLGNHGLNPAGGSPFADNGATPNGTNVAFMQGDGALSQTVSGFTVGAQYYLHYYENSRTTVTPSMAVLLGTNTLIAAHPVPAVGGSNPYHEVFSDVFTATATSLDLAFVKSNPLGGDSTALIDNVAFVPVAAGTAPFVTRNPAAQVVSVGDSATLAVQVIGSLPLSYQWLKNGTAISGATSPALTLSNLQTPDAGDYSVTATNSAGAVTSAVAHLTVFEPIPDLFNTGVDSNGVALADGLADPHYTLIQNPDTNSTYALVEDSTVFPIVSGPWVADTALSKWIGPQFNTSASATGYYAYRVVINLTNRDPKTVVILGRWATDNTGRDIQVNGVSSGVPENTAQFAAWTPFAIYGTNVNFVAGTNTIDFIVDNQDVIGYTGLRAEIHSNVKIPPGVAPEFSLQPVGQTVAIGDTVTFTGFAHGTGPLSYSWHKNGLPIAGQTGLSLTLANVTTADSGNYTLSVSNSAGTTVSQPAQLNVAYRPLPGIYGTGVDANGALLPDGVVDPHYILSVSADPSYPGPNALVITNTWPIQAGTWLPNGPSSRWIGPSSAQRQDLDPTQGNLGGLYTYQTTVNLTGYDVSQVRLVGGWAMDNFGADILINGVSTGSTNSIGFASLTPFTITNGLVAGTNTLDFIVNNTPTTSDPTLPNPTGLRVDLKALLTLPVPLKLQISVSGTTISVSWSPTKAGQKLLSAPAVTGPWTEIVGASNPYTTSAGGTKTFYRVAQ